MKQLQTLTASQRQEVQMMHQMDDMAKKFDDATKALPACKK